MLCLVHLLRCSCRCNIHPTTQMVNGAAHSLQVFYPFVLFYMVAAFLQGGAGTASMGMLNNLRQFLWIPITQNAFRFVHFVHHPPSLAPHARATLRCIHHRTASVVDPSSKQTQPSSCFCKGQQACDHQEPSSNSTSLWFMIGVLLLLLAQ